MIQMVIASGYTVVYATLVGTTTTSNVIDASIYVVGRTKVLVNVIVLKMVVTTGRV